MNKDIKISFIVPVYNAESYLNKCVDSILESGLDKDIEVILVNDGSTDGSSAICDSYAKKNNIVKVIHQENQGVANAMNNGVKASSGKYLFFIDNDDWVDGKEIPELINRLTKTEADISIHKYMIVYPDKSSVGNTFIDKIDLKNKDAESTLNMLRNKRINVMAQWEYVMKRSLLIDNNHIFEPDQAGVHDSCFTPILFSYSRNFYFNDQTLYFWRQRPDSQGKTHKKHVYVMKMLSVLNKLNEYRGRFKEKYQQDYIDFSIYKNAYSLIGQFFSYEDKDRETIKDWMVLNKKVISRSASVSGTYHRILNIIFGTLNGIILSYKLAVLKGKVFIAINKVK